MRIAAISDTHNRLPDQLLRSIAAADEIWHLGDVGEEDILAKIEALGPPVKVVCGNCDHSALWPMVRNFEMEGFRISLVHIPPKQAEPGTDLLIHGHTHVPRDQMVNGTRFLNPGAVSRANKGAPPSFAWLELNRGTPPSWRIERLAHAGEEDDYYPEE